MTICTCTTTPVQIWFLIPGDFLLMVHGLHGNTPLSNIPKQRNGSIIFSLGIFSLGILPWQGLECR